MYRHRRAHLLVLLAITALLTPGCNSSSPTDPLSGASLFAGDWQGTTGQGESISFSVGGTALESRLTRYELTVQIDELMNTGVVACLGAEATVSMDPADVPITNGEFVVDIPGVGPLAGASLHFEGRFESASTASGQLMAETPPTGTCVGRGNTTWTAQKL